jgi:DNA repair protein RecO (recombination protein O)
VDVKARTAEAFVLRTGSLGEADVLITLLCREEGKVRGVARSGRRSRKRFGGALEPATRVRVTYVEREGRDLAQVRDLEVLRSHFEMQREPAVAAACAYLCEVADQFSRENEADEHFFRLLGAVLDALERGLDPSLGARYFELWTCRIQGLLPDLSHCAACERALDGGARYDARHGELFCSRCVSGQAGGTRVRRGTLALARTFLGHAPLDAARQAGKGAPVEALGRLLGDMLLRFVERPFVSRQILEEMTR